MILIPCFMVTTDDIKNCQHDDLLISLSSSYNCYLSTLYCHLCQVSIVCNCYCSLSTLFIVSIVYQSSFVIDVVGPTSFSTAVFILNSSF